MHLKITSIERIDTNSDLFISSDAKGIVVVLKSVGLYNEDGTYIRSVELNKELISLLKQTKINI